VHISDTGVMMPVDATHHACTLDQLFRMYKAVKESNSAPALKSFCDKFRECHRHHMAAELKTVGGISYYTTSMPAGTYKWPQESTETKNSSIVYKVDKVANEVAIEVVITEWARAIEGLVPDCLLPSFHDNVCRQYGDSAAGITAPMAYLGACQPFLTFISKSVEWQL
jgi:hypothetical protein